jgi:hypothetical protein
MGLAAIGRQHRDLDLGAAQINTDAVLGHGGLCKDGV